MGVIMFYLIGVCLVLIIGMVWYPDTKRSVMTREDTFQVLIPLIYFFVMGSIIMVVLKTDSIPEMPYHKSGFSSRGLDEILHDFKIIFWVVIMSFVLLIILLYSTDRPHIKKGLLNILIIAGILFIILLLSSIG